MRDDGVSELLGYAILAGVVITSVLCTASGVGGAITSATESSAFAEAGLAIRSFEETTASVASTGSPYFTASEIRVPAGYELILLDGPDDVTRFTVYSEGREIYSGSTGSVRLQSAFRSVVYEGGAVFSNDSGMVSILRKPPVYMAGGQGKSLYIFLTALAANTSVTSGGKSVVIDARTLSGEKIVRPVTGPVTISISSACAGGWSAALRNAGFNVAQENGKVTATTGGITDVCIECAALQIRIE